MEKKFKKEGWQYFQGNESKHYILNCIEKRKQWLPIIQDIVSLNTGNKFDCYETKYLAEYALVKSIFRALFRYHGETLELAKVVSKEVLEKQGENGANYYCTPPYTYVHFKNDTSESSVFHIDVDIYEGEYIVSWVPLNKCHHKPITLKPRSHHKFTITQIIGAIERRFGIKKMPWFYKRIESPDLECGDYLVWDGRLHHAGNINKSDSTHIALNFRTSTIPDRFEPTAKYTELQNIKSDLIELSTNDSVKTFTEKYIQIYQKIIKNQPWNDKEKTLLEISKLTLAFIQSWDLSPTDMKRVSFGLTLGTMRRSYKNKEVAFINLIANLIAPEYLWSLNSFVKFAIENYSSEEVTKFIDFYFTLYPFKQVEEIIKNLKNKYPNLKLEKVLGKNQNLVYYSWIE